MWTLETLNVCYTIKSRANTPIYCLEMVLWQLNKTASRIHLAGNRLYVRQGINRHIKLKSWDTGKQETEINNKIQADLLIPAMSLSFQLEKDPLASEINIFTSKIMRFKNCVKLRLISESVFAILKLIARSSKSF